jgi:hypothetical protein
LERLTCNGILFPQVCFTCPAKVFIDGGYWCDPGKLDGKSSRLSVARYRPDKCSKSGGENSNSASAELLLRKILGK